MQNMDGAIRVDGNGSASPAPIPTIDFPAIGSLEAHVQRVGDGAVLSLAGEFDLATLGLAERGLQEALASSESGRVAIDLRELTFICSTGIKFLVLASKEHGMKLTVIESETLAVKRVLSIVGIDSSYFAAAAKAARRADSSPSTVTA